MAVNLSPVAGAAAQFFDNSGNVLTGGKLYTYDAGTTTPAPTYTTSSGVTAQPNPIILDAAGRVPDSGEIWLSDSVSYKFVLKDQNDVLIGTYDNLVGINSNFVNFTGEEEQQIATQGQTVFTLTTLTYQPATNNLLVFVNGSKQISGTNYQETSSTVVTFVDGLNVGDVVDFCTATPINTSVVTATQVSYNQGDANAVNTTVEAKLQETVSVMDFGAVGDGVTDDTDAIQNAIYFAGHQFSEDWFNAGDPDAGVRKVTFPTANYKILGTVYVPQGVIIDFQNSTLFGSGYTSGDNILFETGYYDGSNNLVSNATGPFTGGKRIVYTQFLNGRFRDCKTAFNVYGFSEGSVIDNMAFYNCGQAVYAESCWYGRFTNLMSRGSAGGATQAAYEFSTFVNVEAIDGVWCVDRELGMKFLLGANGLTLKNCSVEGGTNGIYIGDETGPIKFDTCYFEALTGYGVWLDADSNKYHVSFDNCFFNTVGTGIQVDSVTNFVWLYVNENNRFIDCTYNVYDSENDYTSVGKVEIEPSFISTPTYPTAFTSDYGIGKKSRVENDCITNATDGFPLIRTKVHGPTLIAFEHEGDAGDPASVSGTGVPFGVTTFSGTTPTTINIDTKIVWRPLSGIVVFRLYITDDAASFDVYGFVFGNYVNAIAAAGKTITVSDNGGYLRLTIGTFTSAAGSCGVKGVIRHV